MIRKPQTKRERITAQNAWTNFIAGAVDDPEKKARALAHIQTVPKKREIRRPVDGKPVTASEHQEQSAVITWWGHVHKRYGLPEKALFAIPNGGARDIITGAKLKREGVRKGVLDLELVVASKGYHGLFLEMKVGDNKPSPDQKEYIEYLTQAGYKATVHWSSHSAIAEISDYLSDSYKEAA